MNNFEEFRQKQIINILSSIKLAALLFCVLVVYNQVNIINTITINAATEGVGLIAATVILIVSTTCVYLLWSFFSNKSKKYSDLKLIGKAESLLFVVTFTVILFISNDYASYHKFLFLLVVITSTIEIGKVYGMFISVLSSVIILVIDLIFAPESASVNLYFQNDLILCGVFIVTAWALGHYVEVEYENLKRKNTELRELNEELVKQSKKQKYFEEIIIKNKPCYELLIENSSNAIVVHQNGKVTFANEGAVKLLAAKSEDYSSGASIFEFILESEREFLKKKFQEVYTDKSDKVLFEQRVVKKSGEVLIVENTSTYFVYDNQPTILSILRDVTSEKQVKKLEKDVEKNIELLKESREFNKLITEFFSNVSHELKTPLNVIYSAVQVLNINIEGHRNKEYLATIKQNCYRLLKLINNILDMTRLDSGFYNIKLQNYNIIGVVEEITLSVVPLAKSKNINIIFDTNTEERVMAFDPDLMERIILNLLSNAIKFTDPEGEIFVKILDGNSHMIISVKDTGVGIPQNKLEMIFERFAQVDKTLRRNCEGSGIGLSLVKSLVELHEGEIEVKSEIGKGSEFVVRLPVTLIDSGNEVEEFKAIESANIDRINIEFSDIYMDFESRKSG